MMTTTQHTYISVYQLSGGILEGVQAYWFDGDTTAAIADCTTGPEVADCTTEERAGATYYVVTDTAGDTWHYRFDLTPATV